MLFRVPWRRLIAPLSFIETAIPPASSEGCVMRFPLESRARLFCSMALFLFRLKLAITAAGLVFIVSDMIQSSLTGLVVIRRRPCPRVGLQVSGADSPLIFGFS